MINYADCMEHTLKDKTGINYLLELCEYVKVQKLPGVVVECGVCNGGSALALSTSGKELYLFDSFQGISKPSEEDGDELHEGDFNAGVDHVKALFRKYGINNAYIYEGWFDKVFPSLGWALPISILHIDVDLYDPTLHCLKTFAPFVVHGGFIIIDDYFRHRGCKAATDTIFADTKAYGTRVGHDSIVVRV